MEYICRRLTLADINLILHMNRNFREGFIQEDVACAFLSDPSNWLFAAIADDTVIGFAYGYELTRLDGKPRNLYIHEVGIMDKCQRQGIGYRMMNELFAACRSSGIGKCFLTAYQNNVGANALYRKLGGQYCPESQGDDTVYYFYIT